MHRRLTLFHLPAQICNLLLRRFSRILLFQNPDRVHRKRRAVVPDASNQILTLRNAYLFPGQCFRDALALGRIDHSAVKTQNPLFRHMFFQKFQRCRHALLTGAIKFHPAAGKLCCRLHKISAIRPETCVLHRNDRRSRRTGKACHIFPAFEIPAHVFRAMEIRCRNQICVHSTLRHLLAKLFNSLPNLTSHFSASYCFSIIHFSTHLRSPP